MDDFKADEKSVKRYLDLRRILYTTKQAKEELFIIIEPNSPPKITRGRIKKWIEQTIGPEYTKISLSAMDPKYNFWAYYTQQELHEATDTQSLDDQENQLGSRIINKLRSAYEEFNYIVKGPIILSLVESSIDSVLQLSASKKEFGVTKSVWKDIHKFIKYRPYCFRDKESVMSELLQSTRSQDTVYETVSQSVSVE
jgi:hypothetical protein